VKDNNEDRVLSELFRRRLEYAEIIPSDSAKIQLMQRLDRKEFMHFIPNRLNIWYLGGIIAAGVAVTLILLQGADGKEALRTSKIENIISGTESALNQTLSITEGKASTEQKEVPTPGIIGNLNQIETGELESDGESITAVPELKRVINAPSNIQGSMPDNVIFSGKMKGKNELQSGYLETGNLIQASDQVGCSPMKVNFTNMAPLYDSCLWSFGDGGFSDVKDPVWLYDVEGEYKVVLSVYRPDGKIVISSVTITVQPGPVARFETTPEDAIVPDDEITFLNFSSGAVKFRWDFGDGISSELFEPKHKYNNYDTYDVSLIAVSEAGCSDSLVLKNTFAGSGYFISFPNAFIPNPNGPSGGYYSNMSDELASIFHPVYAGISEYQLKIFSRKGVQLFESKDINIGWDGYYKGQSCDPGVYVWKVRGYFINGEAFTQIGDITLLKN
jgi:PKD repeat protein